jgi:hypothetical protein
MQGVCWYNEVGKVFFQQCHGLPHLLGAELIAFGYPYEHSFLKVIRDTST